MENREIPKQSHIPDMEATLLSTCDLPEDHGPSIHSRRGTGSGHPQNAAITAQLSHRPPAAKFRDSHRPPSYFSGHDGQPAPPSSGIRFDG